MNRQTTQPLSIPDKKVFRVDDTGRFATANKGAWSGHRADIHDKLFDHEVISFYFPHEGG